MKSWGFEFCYGIEGANRVCGRQMRSRGIVRFKFNKKISARKKKTCGIYGIAGNNIMFLVPHASSHSKICPS